MSRKIISLVLSLGLLFQQTSFAQIATELNIAGYLSRAGSSFAVDKFRPLHLRYFSYDSLNDNFKILLDKGNLKNLKAPELENSTKTLLSYFLIGVTLPDSMFWVNLRPDSEDQIIDPYLEKTDIGKIMLEADLQLKKDTAAMTSPTTPEGRDYWNKLYQKAGELFGSENITIPTLTRPWIVPGEIIVRESKDSAYVYKANLKVMLEQDYLKDSATYNFKDKRAKALNEYSSQLIRELIIPKLTKEINSSKRYAPLRQVYYSLILSRWFKLRFTGKTGTYASLINTRNLTNLISQEPWTKTTYFKQYQKSFQDGEYNIKEPVYTPTGQVIRSYFSGGINVASSAINTQNGIILTNDNVNRLGEVIGGRAVIDPQSISLKPAVTASPIKNSILSGEELASSAISFKDLQNTLRTSKNIYKDIDNMAKKDSVMGISALGMLFRDFDKLVTVPKWKSNMFTHTLEFIDTLEKVRDNNEVAINAAKQNANRPLLRGGLVGRYQELFNKLFPTPEDKEFIFLLAILHDIGAHDGTIGHEDKGAVWINNNLPNYYKDNNLLIEKMKWLIGQHVAVGTMFFGERTPHRLLRLLDELPDELRDKNNKEKILGALAIITFSDGGIMIDNDRADYYINTNLKTLEERKPGFLGYRLRKLARLESEDEGLVSKKLDELYTILGDDGTAIFRKQVGENLDALDYALAFTESIIKGLDVLRNSEGIVYSKSPEYKEIKLELILKVFCMLAFITETEGKDIKWWVEFVGMNAKGDKVAGELKPEQVEVLKGLELQDLTFSKVKQAHQSKEPLFGIFKIERGVKIFEGKPVGKGKEQPMLSILVIPPSFPLANFHKKDAIVSLSEFWKTFSESQKYIYPDLYKTNPDNVYETLRGATEKRKDESGKFLVQYLPFSAKMGNDVWKEAMRSKRGTDRVLTAGFEYFSSDDFSKTQKWSSFLVTQSVSGVPVTPFNAPKPYGAGHVVLVPEMYKNLPQKLTENAVKVALQLIDDSVFDEHLKIGFNSEQAFASIPQLHLQTIFFEDAQNHPSQMPVETYATKNKVSLNGVDVLELDNYPATGFVFESRDIAALTITIHDAVSVLQNTPLDGLTFTPHNLIFTKTKDGLMRVFLFPRKKELSAEEKNRTDYKIGAAFVELGGVLLVSDDRLRDKIINDGVDKVTTQELKRINLDSEDFENLKRLMLLGISSSSSLVTPESRVSSPAQSIPDKKTGGIDFRALPMTIQSMGSFSGLNFKLPQLSQAELRQINVDSEMQQIKNMVQSGITPSGQRIKELIAACMQKKEMNSQVDNLLLCLADIFKLEEENASESSPELREALVIVDSQS